VRCIEIEDFQQERVQNHEIEPTGIPRGSTATELDADEGPMQIQLWKMVDVQRLWPLTVLVLARGVVGVVGGAGLWKRISDGLERHVRPRLPRRHAGTSGSVRGRAFSLHMQRQRLWSSCLLLRIPPIIDSSRVPPSYDSTIAPITLICA
jgi:hypothetical protein